MGGEERASSVRRPAHALRLVEALASQDLDRLLGGP